MIDSSAEALHDLVTEAEDEAKARPVVMEKPLPHFAADICGSLSPKLTAATFHILPHDNSPYQYRYGSKEKGNARPSTSTSRPASPAVPGGPSSAVAAALAMPTKSVLDFGSRVDDATLRCVCVCVCVCVIYTENAPEWGRQVLDIYLLDNHCSWYYCRYAYPK